LGRENAIYANFNKASKNYHTKLAIIFTRLKEVLASLRDDHKGGRRRDGGSQRDNSPTTQSSSSQDDETLRSRTRPPRCLLII